MANPTDDERAAFERWAVTDGLELDRYPAPMTNSENRQGEYRGVLTRVAWAAWQARGAEVSTRD